MMIIPLTFCLLALLLFWFALRLRQRTGLPWAKIVADDTMAGQSLNQPLFAKHYGLVGKPDYIIEKNGNYIPVEVKPGRYVNHPYESDLMQLAAYCFLIEETTGQAPCYGLLRYAQVGFRLDYTPAVRSRIVNTLTEMREALEADDCHRSHTEPQRCWSCGFVDLCEQSLVD